MRAILWDADAFLCARTLSLLGLIQSSDKSKGTCWMTGYIARHELNQLQHEVQRLVEQDVLTIEDIAVRTPAHRKFQELKKSRGWRRRKT